jgi:hypothetical protein
VCVNIKFEYFSIDNNSSFARYLIGLPLYVTQTNIEDIGNVCLRSRRGTFRTRVCHVPFCLQVDCQGDFSTILFADLI